MQIHVFTHLVVQIKKGILRKLVWGLPTFRLNFQQTMLYLLCGCPVTQQSILEGVLNTKMPWGALGGPKYAPRGILEIIGQFISQFWR
jgi:hypothetical protein